MRILMLNTHDMGVGHYRAWGPARALERAGYKVTHWCGNEASGSALDSIGKLHGDALAWLAQTAHEYDIVHAGYSADIRFIEMLAGMRRYANIPFIVDVDDDVYNVPTYNMAFRQYHAAAPGRRAVRLLFKIADGITTSTEILKAEMTRQGDAQRIFHTPNCFDPWMWEGTKRDPRRDLDKDVRVMFSGGPGRYGDLDTVREVLQSIMRTHANVRLFFVACAPDWALEWMPSKVDASANRAFVVGICKLRTYARVLRWLAPDVIINPAETNVFNNSKSHVKALEAGAVGAAYMGTDWGLHNVVPSDAMLKVDNTQAQWKEGLETLITDSDYRSAKAARLKAWVDTQTYDEYISQWIQAYETCIKAGPRDLDAEYKSKHVGVQRVNALVEGNVDAHSS